MTVSGLLSLAGGGNSGMLVTPGLTPVVPGWLQAEVTEATNGRGRIEWIGGAHIAYFGLKVRWRGEDPRRERVRSGEIPEAAAFDLDQVFPKDYSAADIASYVREHWGDRAALSPRDAEQIAEAAVQRQQATQAQHIDRFTEASVAASKRESLYAKRVRAGAESAHPMVSGGTTR